MVDSCGSVAAVVRAVQGADTRRKEVRGGEDRRSSGGGGRRKVYIKEDIPRKEDLQNQGRRGEGRGEEVARGGEEAKRERKLSNSENTLQELGCSPERCGKTSPATASASVEAACPPGLTLLCEGSSFAFFAA